MRIDGTNIAEVSLDSLRSQIAFVFQETVLFDATVEENIRMGQPNASDADVREAAKLAGAEEFIEKLPQGYQTPLGRAGGKLSVGQKQRLSLARAMVRDARILILDEPTSALDPETETRFVATLREVSRDRIVVVIAHRLSTVRTADEILFVDGGEIRERGTHAALLEHPGVFDAVVIGGADERWGSRVAAVVQARPGSSPELASLKEHCRKHIAGYKVPRQLEIVDKIVRSPAGKPDYRWAKEVASSS